MFYNSYQSAAAALEKISGVLEEQPGVPTRPRPIELRAAKGRVQLRGGRVRLPARPGRPAGLRPRDRGGPDDRARRLHRRRQVHAREAHRALLRSRRRAPSGSTASTCASCTRRICAGRSSWSPRRHTCSRGTVADNIALGRPDATREQIVAAARAVGAHEFIEWLPNGYDTDVNKRGGRVSAGQRQLLSFARAFLADPAVLILDEATASLDIPSERLVQQGTADPARRPDGGHHRPPPLDRRDRRPGARHGARPDRRGRHAARAHRRHRPVRAAARGLARLPRVTVRAHV